MPRRRALKGAIEGFLATYTSRESDYQGYWLFGQLTRAELTNTGFNLLGPLDHARTPIAMAHRSAVEKFAEQVSKLGLALEVVQVARLSIRATGDSRECWQGRQRSLARQLVFSIHLRTDTDKTYTGRRTVLVAPHDPRKELRRATSE